MKQVATTAGIIVLTLATLVLLWRWRVVVVLFVGSLAVASALRPLAERLVERGWRGRIALGAAYLACALVTVALAMMILDPLSENLDRLPRDLSAAHVQIAEQWPSGDRFERMVASSLPSPDRVDEVVTSILGERPERWLMLTTFDAFAVLANIVFVFILSLYWSFDRVRFERLWLSIVPVEQRGVAREVWREADNEVGAYVRSEAVQTIVAILLLSVGLYLLGHPYPALVACVGAIAWMIPWFGGLITVALTMALALPVWIVGDKSLAMAIVPAGVCAIAVLTFLEFVVEPRFFDRRRYNSLFVIMLAIGFVELFGWSGLLLAPPTAAAIQIALEKIVAGRRAAVESAITPISADLSVRDRLRSLRADVAAEAEPRPHVLSLIDRLDKLAGNVEETVAENATGVEEATGIVATVPAGRGPSAPVARQSA
jgi:putative permease